jgi:HlyD family secretion protein
MKTKFLFILSGIGVLIACIAAIVFAIEKPAQPPLFNPASNPYSQGIYAEGIVESQQASGSNISMYPEVPGVVTRILVSEGARVHGGQPLLLSSRPRIRKIPVPSARMLLMLRQMRSQSRRQT